jgi:hypothetical protein
MFRCRANRFLLVLAVLLNVAGGPMVFAHSASPGHDMPDSAPAVSETQASEHCASHAQQAPDEPTPSGHSERDCCAAGHCACTAASTFLPASAPAFVRFVRYLRLNDSALPEPPSASLSDPLRPPIA